MLKVVIGIAFADDKIFLISLSGNKLAGRSRVGTGFPDRHKEPGTGREAEKDGEQVQPMEIPEGAIARHKKNYLVKNSFLINGGMVTYQMLHYSPVQNNDARHTFLLTVTFFPELIIVSDS